MRQRSEATPGSGCFWCLEAVFRRIDVVTDIIAGYVGGQALDPTYEDVCTGKTGHAEVIRIIYDPDKISYAGLLAIFWQCHGPTTANRQGDDVGNQYRSIILYHDYDQQQMELKSKEKAARRFAGPIVTEIVPLVEIYQTEDYHQDYFRKNPEAPYCAGVIRPKLEKLRLKRVGA